MTFTIKEDFEWSVEGIALGYISLDSQVPAEIRAQARKLADDRLKKLAIDKEKIA